MTVETCEVGELDLLQIAPHPFVGVEFGRVRRKTLDREAVAMVLDKARHGHGLARVDVVPDHDDAAADVTKQMSEKDQDLFRDDRPGTHQDVELSVRAHPRDRGELRPAIAVPDDGGLALRGPGPEASRNQAEAALVDEDQRGFLPVGFFLMRSHSSRIQRWTSASFRSTACPVGPWGGVIVVGHVEHGLEPPFIFQRTPGHPLGSGAGAIVTGSLE